MPALMNSLNSCFQLLEAAAGNPLMLQVAAGFGNIALQTKISMTAYAYANC